MNKFKFLYFFILPFFFIGCDDDDDVNGLPVINGPDSLVLSHTTYTFPVGGGDFVLSVSSSIKYAVKIHSDWCTVTSIPGSLHDYTVTAFENNKYDVREVQVYVNSVDKSLCDTLRITQVSRSGLFLGEDNRTRKIGCDGGTVDVKLYFTETNWKVTPLDTWIHYMNTKALSEAILNFTVDPNDLKEPRTGKVAIASEDGTLHDTLTIMQEEKQNFELITLEDTVSFTENTVTVHYNIKAGQTISVDIPDTVDWISYTPTRALTADSLVLNVKENIEQIRRSAVIMVGIGEDKEPLTITQESIFDDPDHSTNIIDYGNGVYLVNTGGSSDFFSKVLNTTNGTFYLRSGCSFSSSSARDFKKGALIFGEPNAKQMPVIKFTSKQFGISGNSVIDDIIFKNVELVSKGYIIDVAQSDTYTSEIGSLQFINCYIHDVQSALFRTRQPKGKLGKLVIDGCIVYHTGYPEGTSQKDQALISNAGNGGPCDDMELIITNSTFNDCSNVRDRNLFNFSKATMSSLKVTIENNTFYNCAGFKEGFAILNLVKEATQVATISVKKNIIVGDNTYGINLNEGTPVSCIIEGNCLDKARDQFDHSIIADPGFAAPASGDFTVSNSTVKDAQVGDPRWLK